MNTHTKPGRFERAIKFITIVLLFAGLASNLILAGMHYRDPWVRMKIFFLFHDKRPEYKRMYLKKYHVNHYYYNYPHFVDPYEIYPSFFYKAQKGPKKNISNDDDIKQIPKCRVALALVLIYHEPLKNTYPVCHCRGEFGSLHGFYCGIGMVDFVLTDPLLIPFSAVGCFVFILMLILFGLRRKRIYSALFYFIFICYALVPAFVVINLFFMNSEIPNLVYRMLYPVKYEFEPLIIFSIVFLLLAIFIIDLINAIIVRSCVYTLNRKQKNEP